MAKTVKVTITVSKAAQGFTGAYVEGLDVTKALLPTGGGWFAELPHVEVGSDDDIDILVLAVGFPTVDCTVEVKVGTRAPRAKKEAFSAQGYAVYVFEEPVPSTGMIAGGKGGKAKGGNDA